MESLLGEETLKRLLISLKTPKKWRAMDPIEIAQNLKILCDHFSREEVARRLGINEKGTLWVYLRLLDLPEEVQELVRTKQIGEDVAYRITILRDKEEQIALAHAILEYNLNTAAVRGIVQALKKRNPDMPIKEAIDLALKARPVVTEEHLVVTKIEDKTLVALQEKAGLLQVPIQEILKKALMKILPPDSLTSIRLSNKLVFMSVNEEGFRILRSKAKEEQIKLEDFVDYLARKEALF